MQADNVFHPLCYEGAADVAAISDYRERLAVEAQINEFGQCPCQLFSEPHPRRLTCPSPDQALQSASGAAAAAGVRGTQGCSARSCCGGRLGTAGLVGGLGARCLQAVGEGAQSIGHVWSSGKRRTCWRSPAYAQVQSCAVASGGTSAVAACNA